MKITVKVTILFCVVMFYALPALSQAPSLPDESAPIDGGLSLLIAGGIGYGVQKISKRNKK